MQASGNFVHNSRDKFIKMKVEEQMVPSGGLSPQPEIHGTNYIPKYSSGGIYGSGLGSLDDCIPYGNIADTFDLSLLGDSYEDHDMATVPSPMALMESTWQPMSFYASSPSSEFRAFSPDCMKQYSGDQNLPCSNNQGMSNGNSMMCNSMGDNNGNSAHGNSLSLSNDVGTCGRNVLLRQCLEDTTFQIKYNFKPLDLPVITVTDEVDEIMKSESSVGYPGSEIQSGNESMEMNQIDPVFSLVYEQMRSDVQNTCNILSISQDPTQWSVADAQSWLVQSLSSILGVSYDGNSSLLCGSLRNFWNIDGCTLCSLSEEEFARRDPVNGDRLFANLDLWKMLQWKGDVSSSVSQSLGPSSPQLDYQGLGTGAGSPADSSNDLSNCSSEVSSSPSMIHDIKLYPEQHSPDNFPSPKFSNPSSVDTSSKNSDDESDEDEEKPAEKVKPTRTAGSKTGAHIHLWQFLKELLESGQQHGACIRWLDQSRGVFKIEDSVRVARLWGLRKNRPAMNYDKLSRSIRQYYRKGIMRKTERSQRLVYQFCHPYGF